MCEEAVHNGGHYFLCRIFIFMHLHFHAIFLQINKAKFFQVSVLFCELISFPGFLGGFLGLSGGLPGWLPGGPPGGFLGDIIQSFLDGFLRSFLGAYCELPGGFLGTPRSWENPYLAD